MTPDLSSSLSSTGASLNSILSTSTSSSYFTFMVSSTVASSQPLPSPSLSCSPWRGTGAIVIGYSKHGVSQPALEGFVIHELLKQLCVIFENGRHHARERLVMFDTGVLLVGVLHRILIRAVSGDTIWNVLCDELMHPVGIGPMDVSKLIIESLKN